MKDDDFSMYFEVLLVSCQLSIECVLFVLGSCNVTLLKVLFSLSNVSSPINELIINGAIKIIWFGFGLDMVQNP